LPSLTDLGAGEQTVDLFAEPVLISSLDPIESPALPNESDNAPVPNGTDPAVIGTGIERTPALDDVEVPPPPLEAEIGEAFDVEETVPVASSEDLPELQPYRPWVSSDWNWNWIVISTCKDTHTDNSPIVTLNDVYVDVSFGNFSYTTAAGAFKVKVELDGSSEFTYSPLSLGARKCLTLSDISLGKLSAGEHTITFSVDYLEQVSESDETNNVQSRQFTVDESEPDLIPYQRQGWSDVIVVSNQKTTSQDDALYAGDTLYLD